MGSVPVYAQMTTYFTKAWYGWRMETANMGIFTTRPDRKNCPTNSMFMEKTNFW